MLNVNLNTWCPLKGHIYLNKAKKVFFINRNYNKNCRLVFTKIANFSGNLLQNYKKIGMEILQETFETNKRSFTSATSICMTVPLKFKNIWKKIKL